MSNTNTTNAPAPTASVNGHRLDRATEFAIAAAAFQAGRVDAGEFVDYLKSRPDLQPATWVPLVMDKLPGELTGIFDSHRDSLKAARGGKSKTECPVTAAEFLAGAHPLELILGDGAELTVEPRLFKVDPRTTPHGTSFGWHGSMSHTVDVGGKPVKCQIGVTVTAANSKDAERGDLATLGKLIAAQAARKAAASAASKAAGVATEDAASE